MVTALFLLCSAYASAESVTVSRSVIPPKIDFRNRQCGYKVAVNIHGGGWQAGRKRSANSAAVQWATCQGYAVVNVSYRRALALTENTRILRMVREFDFTREYLPGGTTEIRSKLR